MKKLLLIILSLFIVSHSFAQWIESPPNIYNNNDGNVGIGTTAPANKLHVVSQANTSNAAAVIYGDNYGTYIGVNTTSANYYALNVQGGTNWQGSGGSSLLRVNANGNVGIGITNPTYKLEVSGNFRTITNGHINFLATGAGSGDGIVQMYNASDAATIQLYTNGISYFKGGNVGIGTAKPDSALTVNGGIHAKSILVDQSVPTPDYVFDKDYDLTSLKDVKTYIDQNHHLPEIPSAAQVAKDGINLGEMNAKLLKKIEELTLYLIEKDKKQEALEAMLLKQNKAIKSQQKHIAALERKNK